MNYRDYSGAFDEFPDPPQGKQGNGHDDRPIIRIIAGELPRMANDAASALMGVGLQIYRRDRFLLRPVVEEMDAARGLKTRVAQLARIEPAWLRLAMARVARWEKENVRKKSWVAADPPNDVVTTMLAQFGEWPFPPVAGILTTPTLRPDGTILSVEGYDPQTRLILVTPLVLPPVDPTPENAALALKYLEDLLIEFPFTDEASRSVALSAMMTPMCRAAFPVAPLHAASAPVAGSGKSYLFDTASTISTGRLMPVMAAGRKEEETEKRLGGALLAGQPFISIDNVNGELGGDFLCQAVERPVLDIRILGRSELVRIEARSVTFYATGNNLTLTGDMCRRAVLATLDPRTERPELRTFACDPVAMILADRGRYAAACLAIVRAYILAGRPNQAPRLASFEGWSNSVRSAIMWLGHADPCETMEGARSLDPRLGELRDVLTCWANSLGIGYENRRTLPAVLKAVDEQLLQYDGNSRHADNDRVFRYPELREAVLAVATARGRTDARTFGYWMRRHKGRVVTGLRFQALSDEHGHAAEWYVERV